MQHRRIVKLGPIVLATSEDGSMDPQAAGTHGLFLGDTRFLSRFQIRLGECQPILLGSTEEELFRTSFLFANEAAGEIPVRTLGLLQTNTLKEKSSGMADVQLEMTVVNWGVDPVEIELSIEIGADFFDSFEARGVKRTKRGQLDPPKASKDMLELSYLGLDNVRDTTTIRSKPRMARFENSRMYFPIKLDPNNRETILLEITLTSDAADFHLGGQPEITGEPAPAWFERSTQIRVSNAIVDSILRRSIQDLETLLTEFPGSWVPAAGLPRFAVPFGRDCLIAALQTLSWNPMLARDVLRFLAERQGKVENPWNDEQPGKIMHEMHTGELARLREVPFGLFYGSVDATPLFLVLGAEYVRWTQDLDFYREMAPHFDAAWSWVDKYGDIDGSGYIQYQAHTPPTSPTGALSVGLFNQGWKDSSIAVVYSDGSIVRDHPISLAEVQAYLYRALNMWGTLFQSMPESEGTDLRGRELIERAEKLKSRFDADFWMDDKKFYAMALDGHHRHVDVITSNPGHGLWARIVADERAEEVAARLMAPEMCSSWGIRTMATDEKAFNAFSYHDGSIWPFENSLMVAGLKKYGFVREAQQLHLNMIDASSFFEYRRWPEVYCGVTRETAGVLARQPDACRPQAWSAGAIFALLQSWLGIAPRAFAPHIDITPVLPTGLRELEIGGMSICGSTLGLRLLREDASLLIEITENPGNLDIMIHPASRRETRLHGEDMPAQVH